MTSTPATAPNPFETVTVDTVTVACDGDVASPHPRVFLSLGKFGFADCPYCSRHFVLKDGAHSNESH